MNSFENSCEANSIQGAQAPVLLWLRLEGMAVVAVAAVLYAHTGVSWWLFAALWLVPDLSMIGFLANPRIGSYCYNTVHSYLLPLVLAVTGLVLHKPLMLGIALIWCNHIGVDRVLGYGLKYPAGFGTTHLKYLGKRRSPISA
jgi:hypothetical protein